MTSAQAKAGTPVAPVMNMFYTGLRIARSLGERGISVNGLDLMVEESSQMEETANDFTYGRRRRGVHIPFGCGVRSFRIIPPMTISRAEIDEAIDSTDEALKERTGKKGRAPEIPVPVVSQESSPPGGISGLWRSVPEEPM